MVNIWPHSFFILNLAFPFQKRNFRGTQCSLKREKKKKLFQTRNGGAKRLKLGYITLTVLFRCLQQKFFEGKLLSHKNGYKRHLKKWGKTQSRTFSTAVSAKRKCLENKSPSYESVNPQLVLCSLNFDYLESKVLNNLPRGIENLELDATGYEVIKSYSSKQAWSLSFSKIFFYKNGGRWVRLDNIHPD